MSSDPLPASVKFAALYTCIAFLVTVVREKEWTQGMLPLSFISGLTDMDAITLSIARDQSASKAAATIATQAIILAAVSNTLLKAGMAVVLGSPGLKVRIAIVLGATAAVGVLAMLFSEYLSSLKVAFEWQAGS